MERTITIDGSELTVVSKEFIDANILGCEVGTTGSMGGDSGHGGRTYLNLQNLASTDMRFRVDDDDEFTDVDSLTIVLGGDAEMHTFIEALEFAAKTLRKQSGTTFWKRTWFNIRFFFHYDLWWKIKRFFSRKSDLPF